MKTAEEFLREAHRHAMIKAMKAYAEQFIDAAVTECNKRIIPGHSVQAPTMIGAGEAILKLKEQLK
jgi:hypothetical protein